MHEVLCKYLHFLKLPISPGYCKKLLLSHPEYPSILSIGDTLERLQIDCNILRVEKKDLINLGFPYLITISNKQNELVLVKTEADLKLREKDLANWKGIAIQADPASLIKDKQNIKIKSEERILHWSKVILFSSIAILLVLPVVQLFSVLNLILLLTSTLGLLIGFVLTAKEFGVNYNLVEDLCNNQRENDCDKILSSTASNVFGIFKLSDLVLIYFGFQTLILNISFFKVTGTSVSLMSVLLLFSTLTIPIVIFSLYYQYFKVKAVCKLCLLVDLILIIQVLVIGINFYKNSVQLDFGLITLSILGFAAISSSFLLLKDTITKASKFSQTELRLNRLKYSSTVFMSLLTKQRKVDATSLTNEVQLGVNNAPVKIIMVSNLYCNPCKEAHEKAVSLVNIYPGKVSLATRFLFSGNEKGQTINANQYLIQFWLQNFRGRDNESLNTQKLLRDWYESMDIGTFARNRRLETNQYYEESKFIINRHDEWIKDSGISRTPTFLINGYQLPESYNIEDIAYLVPSLVDDVLKAQLKSQASHLQHV